MEKINKSILDKYVFVGHTNSQGNALSNVKLSKKRAAATHDLLEREFGLNADNLKTGGAGEALPVSDNSTRERRRENSRVELRWYKKY